MPEATIKCLQYVIAGRRRQPRTPPAGAYPAGLGPIPCYSQQPPNTVVPGTPFYAPYALAEFHCGGDPVLHFAFQSVTGLVEGGKVSSDLLNPCSGTVGTNPIVVLNVYVPFGGVPGQPGAVIDAFNKGTGGFFDDNFVTVAPDSGNALTNSGNVFGWVSTAKAEVITALDQIAAANLQFDQWQILAGTGDSTDTVSGRDLHAGKNTSPYAFAFYDPRAPQKFVIENLKAVLDTRAKDFAADLFPPRDIGGDPAYRQVIQRLVDKISSLEKQVGELGKSFIRAADRPDVGQNLSQQKRNR